MLKQGVEALNRVQQLKHTGKQVQEHGRKSEERKKGQRIENAALQHAGATTVATAMYSPTMRTIGLGGTPP